MNVNRFVIACASLLWATSLAVSAQARHTILYSFCQSSGCPDGQGPFAPMAMDAAGNLFGTTLYGGNTSYHGVIYELEKRQNRWRYRVLHDFCENDNCSDGSSPGGALVVDVSGNLYGTAQLGQTRGLVFKLSKNGTYTQLYNFCSLANCTDGSSPVGGLTYQGQSTGALYDGKSALYGTASGGGANNGGIVYALTPAGSETVLYNFGATAQDALDPAAPVILDSQGNLYGTSAEGGTSGAGAIFRLTSGGQETILHSFCLKRNCTDGENPQTGALLLDSQGNLFGTAPFGGKTDTGIVYELSGSTFTVLHSFCAKSGCTDGAYPQGALTLDGAGNLMGVTPIGGKAEGNAGDVFRLNQKLTALYSFCHSTNCPDGGAPYGNVLMDANGNIFGTTTQGGAFNRGTIFELTP